MTSPLTLDQHYLVKLGEECNEVAQRVSKLLLFGPDECQPGQLRTNTERLEGEVVDLLATISACCSQGLLPMVAAKNNDYIMAMNAKSAKIAKFKKYCQSIGMLTTDQEKP